MKQLFQKESGFSFFFFFLIKVIVWFIVPFLIFEFSDILPGEHRGGLGFVSSSVASSQSGK